MIRRGRAAEGGGLPPAAIISSPLSSSVLSSSVFILCLLVLFFSESVCFCLCFPSYLISYSYFWWIFPSFFLTPLLLRLYSSFSSPRSLSVLFSKVILFSFLFLLRLLHLRHFPPLLFLFQPLLSLRIYSRCSLIISIYPLLPILVVLIIL